MKKNILVFPCGSEIAIEIHRSLRFSAHFHLIGASSVDDHGKFVFSDYIGNLPFHDTPGFLEAIQKVIVDKSIDAIYPAMDSVARTLKAQEKMICCKVIGSCASVTNLCASKIATYRALEQAVPCPKWKISIKEIPEYPVFIKPDEGYGARCVKLATNPLEAENFVQDHAPDQFVFCEYLPGKEYTIDCFSDRHNRLLFHGVRQRVRVSNGISVNTVESYLHKEFFRHVSEAINRRLKPRGAWFFQMKENENGSPVLLEVAARLGGSSSYFRAKGINFALLSVFDAFDFPVAVHTNPYMVELDRALSSRYKIDFEYDYVYIDFDDCLIIDGKVNNMLVSFLYQAIDNGKKVVLITRHMKNISESLRHFRLSEVFDEVIGIQDESPKSNYIERGQKAIFIDDSFSERQDIFLNCRIPVFAPDMVEALID